LDITKEAVQTTTTVLEKLSNQSIGVQADARYLPFAEDSYDLVYSSGVLHHSPNIEKSISEIHRILKPGGHAYIMLYATYSVLFMQMRLHGILLGNFSMNGGGETAWITKNLKNPHTETFSIKECQQLFKDFKNVELRKSGFYSQNIILLGRIIRKILSNKVIRIIEKKFDTIFGACLFINVEK